MSKYTFKSPSLADQNRSSFNNKGMLSSFPHRGLDRRQKKEAQITPITNYEELFHATQALAGDMEKVREKLIFDYAQESRPLSDAWKQRVYRTKFDYDYIQTLVRAQRKKWNNSKVGTYFDRLGYVQAIVEEDHKKQVYAELRKRHDLFRFQHQEAPALSMRRCSLMPILHQNTTIYMSPSGYSFGGLTTCDNPNCVRCSKKRVYARRLRIQSSIEGALSDGKMAYFVTLTMRRSDDIRAQIKRMKRAWKAVQNKLDKVIKKKYKGTYSAARAMDITFKLIGYGSNAPYNLHLHCVIIVDVEGLTDEKISNIIKTAWCKSTGESDEKGQDVTRVESPEKLATYCAKMAGLALELASPHTKKGKKHNSLSLPQLMERGIEGDQYAINLYQEFLRAMKGMKTISFSRNWDSYASPKEEDEEEGESPTPVATIPHFWWDTCKYYLDEIGLKLWKSIYLENQEDLAEFQGLMSIESPKEFEDWFGSDCSPVEEFKAWLSN
jgi:hypothetical protein